VTAGVWARPVDWFRIGARVPRQVELTRRCPKSSTFRPLRFWQNNRLVILRAAGSTWSPIQQPLQSARRRIPASPSSRKNIGRSAPTGPGTNGRRCTRRTPYASAKVTGGLGYVCPRPTRPAFRRRRVFTTRSPARSGLEVGADGRAMGRCLARRLSLRRRPVPEQTADKQLLLDATHTFFRRRRAATGKNTFFVRPHSLSLTLIININTARTADLSQVFPDDFMATSNQAHGTGGGVNLGLRFLNPLFVLSLKARPSSIETDRFVFAQSPFRPP